MRWLDGIIDSMDMNLSKLHETVKNRESWCAVSACNSRDPGSIPGLGRSPRKGMVTHSSILAWRIPQTEEPGGLQATGLRRVRHDQVTYRRKHMLLVAETSEILEVWIMALVPFRKQKEHRLVQRSSWWMVLWSLGDSEVKALSLCNWAG